MKQMQSCPLLWDPDKHIEYHWYFSQHCFHSLRTHARTFFSYHYYDMNASILLSLKPINYLRHLGMSYLCSFEILDAALWSNLRIWVESQWVIHGEWVLFQFEIMWKAVLLPFISGTAMQTRISFWFCFLFMALILCFWHALANCRWPYVVAYKGGFLSGA